MNKKDEFNDLIDFVKTSSSLNKLKKKKQKKIIILILNIISIFLLIIGGYGLKTIADTTKDLEDAKALENRLKAYKPVIKKDDEKKEEKTIIPTFNELLKENSDTVGWIKVNNTGVDLPVVHTTDNEFYMNHDFNKNYNSMGWVFADYRNTFPDLSKNTILYGHTYKDTIMFSTLTKVLTNDWQSNGDNLYITFNTIYDELKWQIFSIYTISETNDYLQVDFTDDEFLNYIETSKSRSKYKYDVEVNSDDKIITLSTCYIDSNHRLVIQAKLINQ